jgi:hypothetical protein
MLELLLKNGARMSAATWIRVICFIDVVDANDPRVLLEQQPRQEASAWREGVSTRW